MEQLRRVELCDFDLYPEPENSELDWPFSDKVDFYIQAYVLNSLECLLNKKLTFELFKAAFENKLVVKRKDINEMYFYGEVLLFSKKLGTDDNADLFYQIQL
jgi:hypothetical protein